jgi:hypothetical protein
MCKVTIKEWRADRDLVRRIVAAGVPVDVPKEEGERPPDGLFARQTRDLENSVFDLPSGGTGVTLALNITSNLPGVFVLNGFELTFAGWEGAYFELLQEAQDPVWPHFEFCGEPGRKFNAADVLNRRLGVQLRRGCRVRGFLLAWSLDAMPESITQGSTLTGRVHIFDQFDAKTSAAISLRVDRSGAKGYVERKDLERKKRKPRKPLFECPDWKPEVAG